MFIPIAILNEPIFDLEYPSSALFGQAGMVIAHEMVRFILGLKNWCII
jgi:predicted metalloendopeptidase